MTIKSPLWSASEIRYAVDGVLQGDFDVFGISNDTRTLQEGDLYIALSGRGNHDGHDFVPQALAQGAAGVLVQQNPVDKSILVSDTFAAMQQLGVEARNRVNAHGKMIGITGSVGKTTCRALTEQALKSFGGLHASTASLNNHWGVPLSLARMPRETQFGVFEIGMNHADEITPLSQFVRPHVAIITTIDAAHIGNFSDGLDGIARAKAEIFAGLEPGGTTVLPADSAQLPLLESEAARYDVENIIRFGRNDNADLRLISYERQQRGGRVTASYKGHVFSFALPIRGEHNAMNALAALGAAIALNLNIERAAASFAEMQDVEGRGNSSSVTLNPGKTITLIDDRHNSSPVALNATIRELGQTPVKGRRILALGDMLELGEQAPALHAGIAPAILANNIDLTLTCGPLMKQLSQALPSNQTQHFTDSTAMAEAIGELLQDGDAVLVKGSRGAQMIHVVDALNRMGQSA
jgi:UDP-N-acetylmuramoyl-tripeptide--D-alanyl-D-alanine ligase